MSKLQQNNYHTHITIFSAITPYMKCSGYIANIQVRICMFMQLISLSRYLLLEVIGVEAKATIALLLRAK